MIRRGKAGTTATVWVSRHTGRLITGGGSSASGAPKGGVNVCDECHRPARKGLAEGSRYWCPTCQSHRLHRAGRSIYGPLSDGPKGVPAEPHPANCTACRVRPPAVGADCPKED